MNSLAHYFSFEGRARRTEFWATQLAAFGVLIAYVVIVVGISMDLRGASVGGALSGSLVLTLLSIALVVFWLWIHLAVGVRRAHDRDRPGSFLLWGLVPVVGHWILLVELGFMDSIRGSNAYGVSQKYPVRAPGEIG